MHPNQSFRTQITNASSLQELEAIKAAIADPKVSMRAKTFNRCNRALYLRKLELQRDSSLRRNVS